jgi:hypothetical protein
MIHQLQTEYAAIKNNAITRVSVIEILDSLSSYLEQKQKTKTEIY